MSKYPKYMPFKQGRARNLLLGLKVKTEWLNPEQSPICKVCHRPIKPDEVMLMREVQVDWFRNNDEAEYYHPECRNKK